jgi:Holliday junction resolvase RusA-like endonuclease
MSKVEFTVLGDAVGKGRPRATRQGAFVRMYTPKKTADYESLVKAEARLAMAGKELFTDAVNVSITIYVEPIKSMSKKNRVIALAGAIRPTKKPDIDNSIKALLDAMNGVVYVDDNQVVELSASKVYGSEAKVIVSVENVF